MKRVFLVVLILALLWSPFAAVAQVTDAVSGSNASISCGTSATVALSANSRRRSFLLVAPSSNAATVYVGFSASVTTGTGIPLNANNSLSDNTYVGTVYCIVASGTVTLIASQTSR